jgi:hypothetical protein
MKDSQKRNYCDYRRRYFPHQLSISKQFAKYNLALRRQNFNCVLGNINIWHLIKKSLTSRTHKSVPLPVKWTHAYETGVRQTPILKLDNYALFS